MSMLYGIKLLGRGALWLTYFIHGSLALRNRKSVLLYYSVFIIRCTV